MDNLIAYIRSHSIEARQNGDMIEVQTVFTKDGKAFVETEFVQPNVKAVRDYLGY